MTSIGSYGYFVGRQRRIEAGPAGPGLKFRNRAEQLIPACGAEINSFFVIIPILILVWRFRFCFPQDLKLSGSQNLSPLVITQRHFLRHRSGLNLSPDSNGFCVFRHAEGDRQDAEQKQG
jgi:hypothetical protein